MLRTKQDFISKIHLMTSVLIVIPVSFVYGFYPESQFDIYLNTIDEQNQFKAIMVLYLGFSILWILGIFKTEWLKIALTTNVVFMLGLGFGRFLSWCVDGTPTFVYQFGTIAELFLGFYGLWVLSSNQSTTNT